MSQRLGLMAAALVLCWTSAVSASDLSLSIKPEFSTGDYGTNTRTRVWEVPFEVKWRERSYGFGLRLPYIHEAGTQQVVPGFGPLGSANPQATERQGLGNLRLSAWAELWEHAESGVSVTAGIKLSPPAIRHMQPMGVGFTRVGLELEAHVPLPQRFSLDLTLGRRLIIGAPGLGLRDYWYGTVDLGRDLSDSWSAGLTIDTQAASSPSGTAILEIGPWVQYAIAPGWRVGAYLFRGFTRDSADWGGGLTLTHRFAI